MENLFYAVFGENLYFISCLDQIFSGGGITTGKGKILKNLTTLSIFDLVSWWDGFKITLF